MNKWLFIALVPILLLGSSLRVPNLAERPMHHDEANQAYRFGILLEQGRYAYDPEDHHGPSLYYFTLPIAALSGARSFAETNETTYRLLPVFFSLLLIVCLPLLRNGLGNGGVLAAALFTAISPAMAYYARFYIQETLLVFFTFMTMAAGWLSFKSGSLWWALLCGVSAGLMFATKETAVIAYAAMAGAALLASVWSGNRRLPWKNLSIAGVCALGVAFVLFSSFFTNLDGPLEAVRAFKGYFARGAGLDTDHVHPWNFYLKMLTFYRFDGGPVWSEGLFFGLGLIGCLLVILKRLPSGCHLGFARFLMIYTILLTFAYSAIAYKTPWCILSFLHGWILLAGIAAARLVEWGWNVRYDGLAAKSLSAALFIVGLFLAAGTYGMARRTVFRYGADYRNPYVYAHTTADFMRLVQRVADLSAISPRGTNLYIQVVAEPDATWPLPFYLRGYPNTGYWVDADLLPKDFHPDIIISAVQYEGIPDSYVSEYYGLRPDTLLSLNVEQELWNAFMTRRGRNK